MKDQPTYSPNFNAEELIKEVSGSDYYNLVTKKEQEKEISERNARLMIIDTINKCRKLIGETPCVDDTFYKFLDMDFEDLQHVAILYQDEAEIFARKNRMINFINTL